MDEDSSSLKSKRNSWSAGTILQLMGGLLVAVTVVNWCFDGGELKHTSSGVEQRHLISVPDPPRPQPGGPANSSCAKVCGNVSIPYPFGLSSECARNRHFQLDCRNISVRKGSVANVQTGFWPFLTTARGSYTDNYSVQSVDSFQVLNIFGNNGSLMIDTTAIKATSCSGSYDLYNTSAFGNASIILPPDGPYRSSPANVFFVVGCRSGGQYSYRPIETFGAVDDYGRGGVCGPNSCTNQFRYPFCNLYDCCIMSMTPLLEIYLMGGGTSYPYYPNCGFSSVLLPQSYYTDFDGEIGRGTYGMQLLWALQVNVTQYPDCLSLTTTGDYACSPLPARCEYVNETRPTEALTGYYCRCPANGYEGDGYLNGTGCKDIDECANGDLNQCALDAEAICTNLVGSYNCSCPPLMEGDGFVNGSGCTYIDFCQDDALNNCAKDARCKSEKGLYNCTCPSNTEGDGREDGTGCKSKSRTALIAGLAAGGAVLFVIINGIIIWWFFRKRQRHYLKFGPADFSRREFLLEIQSKEGANICKLFSLDELTKATNNFSIDRVLGTGGFGTVYEGTMDDGTNLAIKKAKHDVGGGRDDTKQFINEVTILSQVNHRNLVKLLGCCLETLVPVLIYEFISNGNLQEHLQRPKGTMGRNNKEIDPRCPPPLDWDKRLKIAIGTAEALTYLHSGTSPPIYHRDVKSANILLDHNYVAKVADFGLSKFVPLEATHLSTAIQGTPGYLDPEYFDNYQITDKSDVYSFGVVLLELITSEKPVDLSQQQARDHNLALRCNRLLKHGRLEDIIDPHLGASSNPAIFEVVHSVAQVAMKCVERYREDRPTMKEVLEELQVISKSARKHAPTDQKEKLRPYKVVRFEDDLMPLVSGMTTNTEDFYFSPNNPSSSSNLPTTGSREHDGALEFEAR